ncbi:homeobox protein 13-like [Nylanderia fulva]|uniref:homeobox protein 13-like n=1 Tax=Nylanderia fulva TaxID=613905 RepID=UPI0010FB473D|nr:homeobox protein 13-like [Nylanderia fulva]
MAAFLENSLFFFMDDAEPILPIFRSSDYGDPGRIVEVTDVSCDTETTYPAHFSHNEFHRRRGGAETYRSTRRITEWPNERAKRFPRTTATILNDNQDRSGHHTESKARRINRDYDYYINDLDYDLGAENPYDYDFELLKNDPPIEYKDTYYTQFVDPQSLIGYSNRKKVPRDTRYNYAREPARNIRANQRENASSRQWTTESDERNFHEDIRSRRSLSNERKKRTKILSKRRDENFNCEEFGHAYSKDKDFWDSVSLENEASCEELTDQTKLMNRDDLQRKTSYNIVDSDREESEETRRENISPETSARNVKYERTSKNDGMKPKSLQSNSPHIQSARTPIGQMSNLNSAGKNSINMRPRSAVEGKKIINSPSSSERRTENTNATFTRTNVDDRRSHITKLSNKTQPAKTFKRIADSNSNERIYATNEEDNANYNHNKNPYSRNSENNKIDRTNVAVSRSSAEEKDEKTFSLRMTSASSATGTEKEKKRFFSRLPIRTWKRLRTKEPVASHPESNEDANSKFQAATTNNSNDLEKTKDDEIPSNRLEMKRSNRFAIGSISAEKPEVTSSNIKKTKGLKNSSTARKVSEQQKKRTNIK